jgi:hypothetical protein
MKYTSTSIVAAILTLASTHAATIIQNNPTPLAGVPYRWNVTLGQTDSGSFSRHVGAWSWEDDSLFPNPGDPVVGWTHTSDWAIVTLTSASRFTILMERDATVPWPGAGLPDRLAPVVSMFPSFTLFSGSDINGPQNHTYNNRGNVTWAEGITFLDFVDNSTEFSATRTWDLAAGTYTLALGSNSPATNPDRQGYRTILTTAIPEPSMSLLLLGSLALFTQRRRNTQAK